VMLGGFFFRDFAKTKGFLSNFFFTSLFSVFNTQSRV